MATVLLEDALALGLWRESEEVGWVGALIEFPSISVPFWL